jgi:membrane protein implicated in regulation of membrane protease activity
MTLGWKLFVVFLAFLTILAIVLYMAFRERRLGKSLADDDTAGQQASDARVMAVIFTAIFGGMFLTLIVGWLVFL